MFGANRAYFASYRAEEQRKQVTGEAYPGQAIERTIIASLRRFVTMLRGYFGRRDKGG